MSTARTLEGSGGGTLGDALRKPNEHLIEAGHGTIWKEAVVHERPKENIQLVTLPMLPTPLPGPSVHPARQTSGYRLHPYRTLQSVRRLRRSIRESVGEGVEVKGGNGEGEKAGGMGERGERNESGDEGWSVAVFSLE